MYSSDMDWEDLQATYKWKEAINFVKDKEIEEKSNGKLLNNIKDILKILIFEADTYEDIVLATFVMYMAYENKLCNKQYILEKFGTSVYKGVDLLMERKNEEYSTYIKRVFENEEVRYVGKIKLAQILYECRNLNIDNLDETKRYIEKINEYILCYKNQVHRKLIDKLQSETNKLLNRISL